MPSVVEIDEHTWQVGELKFFTTDLDEIMRRHDAPERWRADVTVTLPNETKWVGAVVKRQPFRNSGQDQKPSTRQSRADLHD